MACNLIFYYNFEIHCIRHSKNWSTSKINTQNCKISSYPKFDLIREVRYNNICICFIISIEIKYKFDMMWYHFVEIPIKIVIPIILRYVDKVSSEFGYRNKKSHDTLYLHNVLCLHPSHLCSVDVHHKKDLFLDIAFHRHIFCMF